MFGYQFYWPIVWNALPELLSGVWVTAQLTALSFVLGTLIAMPMAVARQNDGGGAYR